MYFTTPRFWKCYKALPEDVQRTADRCYELLQRDSSHPSLHFKKIGDYWSVRAGADFRALGLEIEEGILWFWIGTHAEYDHIISRA